jgi:hypothetical protein
MSGTNITPLIEVLGHWHEFYALVGEASATLIGLLFVAASVSSGVFTMDRPAALRVFLSASVVNFSSIVAASMVVLSPIENSTLLGGLIVACGALGLTHTGLACRDAMRDGLLAKIDLEDRTWYLVLPLILYLCEAASGIALALRWDQACMALALSVGMLLLVAIHNAWDITVWTITRRRQ